MFGTPRYHLTEITSTNDLAKTLARDGAPHGTLVTADFQTAGRGRQERSWNSRPGLNFLGSFILHPRGEPSTWGGIPLLSGIAVHDSLKEWTGVSASLKWPNDLLVDGKKIAGILIESHLDPAAPWLVIGIGCNINQQEFPADLRIPATSVVLETGRILPVEEFTPILAERLEHWYRRWEEEGTSRIAEEWKRRSTMFGRRCLYESAGFSSHVTIIDLRDDGSLLARTDEGELIHIRAGDITLRETAA